MTIEIIHNKTEFHLLKDEWNSLLSLSASHVPFLRHEFQSSWWSNLGGNEWETGKLAVLVQRESDQALSGIAPFFLHEGRLMLIGSHQIADYLDLITAADNLDDFISAIIQYLSSTQSISWDELDLYNLPEASPTLKALNNAAEAAGWKISQEIIQPAPAIQLPSTWERYLESLDPRYQNEINRKIRNAEEYFLPVDWYISSNETFIENELDEFLQLMADNPEKELFLTDPMRNQIKDAALAAFREGWLQLAFLTVGGIKAAGYLNFDFNGVIWIYNSGINSTFENISPGWVLLSRIIDWAIREGRSKVDFMRGDEAYKYQFGGMDQHVVRLRITRS